LTKVQKMSIDDMVKRRGGYFGRVQTKYPNLFETRQRLENGLKYVSKEYQKKLDSLFSRLVDLPYKPEVRRLMNTAIDKGYNPNRFISHYKENHPFLGSFLKGRTARKA